MAFKCMCAVKWDKSRKSSDSGVNRELRRIKTLLLYISDHKTHIVSSRCNLLEFFLMEKRLFVSGRRDGSFCGGLLWTNKSGNLLKRNSEKCNIES
jgi:hypothetical protein